MTIEKSFARKAAVLIASGALLLAPGTAAAVAAPSVLPAAPESSGAFGAPGADGTAAKADDRSDPAADERRALNQQAIEKVVRGEAPVRQQGGSQSVQVAPGQWAEYGLEDSDQILSFLIDFGSQVDPRFPASAPGPQHNGIPQPNRSVDNSTYWLPDFSREHYQNMFFDPAGESLKTLYEEMSSGRYTVDGDVSDWVTVPYNSASYGETESQEDMTRFVQDAADAWYESQIAAGKSPADVDAYLAGFDQWDRYDYNNNGNFDEPDGYIDHFQAIHAGEGEEAGAATSAIWSHRWSVGQAGYGIDGPATNPFGGIRIGDSKVWIRDYTTEPENGGLGVFAHEYGHDLGLPDLYDTAGGDNGTGFWTLMSSGSWLGRGTDSIGTTPNHMGAWEKLQLGWLDYDVATAGQKSTHMLGASYHATKKQQALVVTLPRDAQGNGRYYIAENRQYAGYDSTLQTGPYNFGWPLSSPDKVEHFPYQNGLLVTYWNAGQRNNNTSQHPGAGLVLPVDARATALRWTDGTVARNRIQSFDATFGKEATDPILLHRETAAGMTTLQVPSRPGVAVFDDSNPNAYYDPANPQGSVVVAGTGTKITVVQSNPKGMMTVKVN
ncbi:immune inhibitor A domain-containing protein [Arthrobacter sp. zg-Y1143]|uniref:immune inhibitor A domain-containing protein n=1 Tax=Arthrobacter sp. zg-Y1143 TaxID=3049065 RepID=UPI0024C27ABE|nr:immune inhibitor A domain-containing protein [Arthrobacter sp. zg-Y1143]MDK1327477.1 immune inhibitor A [Arthrobacter sp. zg-Y1143]